MSENTEILLNRIKELEQQIAENNQKKQNSANSDSNINYRTLFLRGFLPSLLIDAYTLRILDLNPAAEKLYDYPEGFLRNKSIMLLIDDIESRVRKRISETLKGNLHLFNSTHKTSAEKKITVRIFAEIIELDNEKYIFYNVLDISEKIEHQRKIETLSLGITQSPIAIFQTDENGIILFANTEFFLSTNYAITDIIGKTSRVFRDESTPEKTFRKIWQYISKGNVWRGELSILTADKRTLLQRVAISPIMENGKISGYFCFMEDITEQKKIENALFESEQKYHFIINASPDIIFMIDISGKILFVNTKSSELLNYDSQVLIGKKIEHIFRAEMLPNYKVKFKEILQNGQVRFETQILHQDGRLIDVEYHAFKSMKDNEDVIVGSIRDISERKQAENQFQSLFIETNHTKDLLRSIIQASEDIIYAKEKTGKYLMGGKAFTKHLNCSSDSVRGKNNEELEIIETGKIDGYINLNHFQSDDYEVMKSLKTKAYEGIKIIFPDGFKGIFDIKKIPVKDETGEASILITIGHDITARARAEEELIQLNENLEKRIEEKVKEILYVEENFQNLFQQNQDALFITNKEGIIILTNNAALEKLGYTREELFGCNVSEIVTEKYRNQRHSFVESIFKNNYKVFESENVTKTGQIIPVEISSTKLFFNNEEVILSSARDITYQKEHQKRIMQTIIATEEKERLRFARDIHDGLGADLSAIKLLLDLTTKDPELPEKFIETLNEAKELMKITADSAREIAHNMKPHLLQNYGFKETVLMEVQRMNQTMDIFIDCNLDMFNVRLIGNTELNIYRIWKELLNNSLKYAHASQITVLMFISSDILHFSYKDNGVGFDIKNLLASQIGNGLLNIETRVGWMNGTVEFQSAPGEGFQAYFKINIASLTEYEQF